MPSLLLAVPQATGMCPSDTVILQAALIKMAAESNSRLVSGGTLSDAHARNQVDYYKLVERVGMYCNNPSCNVHPLSFRSFAKPGHMLGHKVSLAKNESRTYHDWKNGTRGCHALMLGIGVLHWKYIPLHR